MTSFSFIAIVNTQLAITVELEDTEVLELIESEPRYINDRVVDLVRELQSDNDLDIFSMEVQELRTIQQYKRGAKNQKRAPLPNPESEEEMAEEESKGRDHKIEDTDNWTIGSWKTIPGVDPSCALWDWEPKEGKPTKFMIWYHRGESTVTKYPAEEREQTFKWLSMLFPDPTE